MYHDFYDENFGQNDMAQDPTGSFSFLDSMMGADRSAQNEYARISSTHSTGTSSFPGSYHSFLSLTSEEEEEEEEEEDGIISGIEDHQAIWINCPSPTTNLPELPVEIWEEIFAFSTCIPGTYAVDDYGAIYGYVTFDTFGIRLESRLQCVMKDKLAFSCVSKLWNKISQRFLFEYLRITGGSQASSIADALKFSAKEIDARSTAGKWTTRIDLALEGEHAWQSKHTHAMVYIFQRCPNLKCFSSAFSTPDPWRYSLPSLLRSLASHRSLRRLEVKVEKDVMRTIEVYLGGFLEVLYLVPCRRLVSLDKSKESYTLPKLRTLAVAQGCDAYVRELNLPNLQACILAEESIRTTLPFIDKGRIEYLSASDLRTVISELSAWSSLRTLVVMYSDMVNQSIDWSTVAKHHALECIIIDSENHERTERTVKNVTDNIANLINRSRFPQLRCVKVPLGRIPPFTDSRDVWRLWSQTCQGVEFEVSLDTDHQIADEWKEVSAENLWFAPFMGWRQ